MERKGVGKEDKAALKSNLVEPVDDATARVSIGEFIDAVVGGADARRETTEASAPPLYLFDWSLPQHAPTALEEGFVVWRGGSHPSVTRSHSPVTH